MAPSLLIEKVSENYENYIVTSGYLCSFINYLEFLEAPNRRQCFEKDVIITEDISAKLYIYPTGCNRRSANFISIYLQARWKKSKAIVIKFDTAVLDTNGRKVLPKSSENFEKISTKLSIGESRVLHSALCYDKKQKILNNGCVTIVLNLSVNIAMMIHPEMLDRFEVEYKEMEAELLASLSDPHFGDTVLIIHGRKYYVERKVLIQGNPLFEQFFSEEKEVDGYFKIMNRSLDVWQHIIVDCYLNGKDGANVKPKKLKLTTRRKSPRQLTKR